MSPRRLLLISLACWVACGQTPAADLMPSPGEPRPDRGRPGEAGGPEDLWRVDRQPCQSPRPPRSNFVDTCQLAHRPDDPEHLSARRPGPTEPVTVRLQTQTGDLQAVTLRVWTGVERLIPMTLEDSSAGLDIFRATIPPSARPVYYRFRLQDGGALLFLTRSGVTADPTGADDFWIAPLAKGKTLHYRTNFAQPELHWKGAAGYAVQSMVAEGGGSVGASSLGSPQEELRFYLRDAKSGKEDRPPGGGDYRMPGDLVEAWLDQGVVFDVDPASLALELIDSHTHPYGAGLLYDPQPLLTLAPQQGIGRALTMVTGSPAAQRTALGTLHAGNRWVLPLVWVDPASHSVAEVEDLLANHGFKGLKFHPTIAAYPADGALMDPFLTLAAQRGVPVQIHTATDDPSQPSRVIALAKRHPAARIIMVHTNLGELDKTGTLAAIKGVPNLYAETSWTNPQTILQAMSVLDSSRTIFGTDATVDGAQQFSKQSIANPQGQYVYTIPAVIAEVKALASPAAYANWARLTALRLYDIRFRPEPDRLDTDGDGFPDQSDPDPDNDGKLGAADPAPLDPGE